MLCTAILACRAQDKTPHYPTLAILRLLLHALANFLYSFHYIAFFKFCESPMHVRVMALSVKFFSLTADIERLGVNHVDIKQEGQIVVCVGMFVIQYYALFEMFDSVLVVSNFEIGKAKVVVQLRVILEYPL